MDINYIDLRFENNGKILEVGKGSSYRLLSIDGISSPDYDLSITGNALADGSKVNKRRVKSRSIAVEAEYVGKLKKQERDNLVRFFNIHQGGTLYIDNNGIKRSIDYDIDSFNSKIDNMYMPLKFLVNLYCKDPYFLNKEDITNEIVTWVGGLTFPLELPTTFAVAGAKIMNVKNEGDVATPITIEIYGPANFPKIQVRETGEYIKVNKKLTADDVVTITTQFGNKRVELNGVNAFNILELPGSTFFDLAVGDNVVELTTLDESEDTRVRISYRNRYIGI